MCELNGIDYLFGLARNARLTAAIAAERKRRANIAKGLAGRRAASRTSHGRPM
jgi:hypothetical protein